MTSASNAPIFLLAFERSGTNLLRRFLKRHAAIDGPAALQTLDRMWLYEASYGDLGDDQRFRILAADVIETFYLTFEPWSPVATEDEIVAAFPPGKRDLMGVYMWLMDRHAARAGKRRWFCKDRNLIDHAWELAARFPEAKFVYMYRDPRDVYASYRAAPGGYKHPWPFADDWANAQARCIRFAFNSPCAARTFAVSYEDILEAPGPQVERLCEFLGESYDPSLIGTEGGAGISTDNSYWKNLSQAVMTNNRGKYRTQLSRGEIRLVEERTWIAMRRLGYQPEVATAARTPSAAKAAAYRMLNAARIRFSRPRADVPAAERATVARRARFRRTLEARRPE